MLRPPAEDVTHAGWTGLEEAEAFAMTYLTSEAGSLGDNRKLKQWTMLN